MITFTISVNYRDTEVSASEDGKVIWNTIGFMGGADWIFDVIQDLIINHNLLIGKMSADQMIKDIGSAIPLAEERTKIVRGRDLTSGMPASKEISSIQLREVIKPVSFADSLRVLLELPPITHIAFTFRRPLPDALKLSLSNSPIVLTGEYGNLRGLDELLQDALGLAVVLADDAGLRPEDKLIG